MLPRRSIALLLPLAALLGCGGNAYTPPSTPAPNLTGNWQFQVQTNLTPPVSLLFNLLGNLTVQGSTATGTFRVSGSQPGSTCPSSTQDIAFTGSIDAGNVLTLTSAPFSGSVATLQLQLPLNANGFANGTVKIAGGTCALPLAVLAGILVPPLTGTYAGTLNPATGTGGPVSVTFTQSSVNADGQFPVSATLSFTAPTCTVTATLTGVATGLILDLSSVTPIPAGSPALLFSGGLPPTGAPFFSPILIVSDPSASCARGGYSGALTHQ